MNERSFHFLLLAILLLLLFVRIIPEFEYSGFFEPDVFYHYSVLTYAAQHGFSIPVTDPLDGQPVPEPHGLYLITLVPFSLLSNLGISLYATLLNVPLIFALLEFIAVYLLAKQLNASRMYLLLVPFLLATNIANISRTSATTYRGDLFSSVFLLIALILTIKVYEKSRSAERSALLGLCSGVSLSFASLTWNGAPSMVVVYLASALALMVFGFLKKDTKMLAKTAYCLLALGAWYLLVSSFYYSHLITYQQSLTGKDFLVVYIGAAALLSLLYALVHRLKSLDSRLFLVSSLSLLMAILVLFLFPTIRNSLLLTQSNDFTPYFTSSIQELQRPTLGSVLLSLGLSAFLTPMSLVIAIGAFLHAIPVIVVWILVSIMLLLFLFLDFDKKGIPVWKLSLNPAKITVGVYFDLTAFLYIHFVRFGALFSIPLCILSGYALYWFVKKFGKKKILTYSLLSLFILVSICLAVYFVYALRPLDSINPAFIGTMNWIRNNTPANATFLTFWPDGGVIEGFADRYSISDSVGALGESVGFSDWLLSSTNSSYLLRLNPRPTYFLYRPFWLYEIFSICDETINVSCGPFETSNAFVKTNMFDIISLNSINYTNSSMVLIYQNSSARIFKINYNAS